MRRKRLSAAKKRRHRTAFQNIRVRARPGRRSEGWLQAGALHVRAALGSSGIRANKREGDRATPKGCFRLLRLWWRADRTPRPRTLLPLRRIKHADAWCEDPNDRRYNRPMRLTRDAPGDRLWREDHLYDFMVELDHNSRPRVTGRGSAVFLHVARPGFHPTAGCVALAPRTLRRLLERIGPRTRILIG
jgi:L,D-peptidoglycan transpeptidase YkuD (ErfK/YbiS/YcfS/YnhG family)